MTSNPSPQRKGKWNAIKIIVSNPLLLILAIMSIARRKLRSYLLKSSVRLGAAFFIVRSAENVKRTEETVGITLSSVLAGKSDPADQLTDERDRAGDDQDDHQQEQHGSQQPKRWNR